MQTTYKLDQRPRTVSLKKIFWLIIILLDITIMVGVVYADRWVEYLVPKVHADEVQQIDNKWPQAPDPNRPYFDLWGNRFDYNGNLLNVSETCYPDNQAGPNPYCQTPTTPNNSIIEAAPAASEGGMK